MKVLEANKNIKGDYNGKFSTHKVKLLIKCIAIYGIFERKKWLKNIM